MVTFLNHEISVMRFTTPTLWALGLWATVASRSTQMAAVRISPSARERFHLSARCLWFAALKRMWGRESMGRNSLQNQLGQRIAVFYCQEISILVVWWLILILALLFCCCDFFCVLALTQMCVLFAVTFSIKRFFVVLLTCWLCVSCHVEAGYWLSAVVSASFYHKKCLSCA